MRKKRMLGEQTYDTLHDPKCPCSADVSHGFLVISCYVNIIIKYSGHYNLFFFIFSLSIGSL